MFFVKKIVCIIDTALDLNLYKKYVLCIIWKKNLKGTQKNSKAASVDSIIWMQEFEGFLSQVFPIFKN